MLGRSHRFLVYNGTFNHIVLKTLFLIESYEDINLFSCSPQLSMKSKMLISTEIAKIDGIFRFSFGGSKSRPGCNGRLFLDSEEKISEL